MKINSNLHLFPKKCPNKVFFNAQCSGNPGMTLAMHPSNEDWLSAYERRLQNRI